MKKPEKKKVIIDLESSEESVNQEENAPKKKLKSEYETIDSDKSNLTIN